VWKWLVGILLVVAVLGGVGAMVVLKGPMQGKVSFTGLGGGKAGEGTKVKLAAAETGDLVRTVSAPGAIEPRTLVKISSQVSAKILALPFREGDEVKAGDVVVRLDPQDLTAVLDRARAGMRGERARLTGAEADLINARLNFDRLRQLFETGDVTKADLDGAEARLLQAESTKQVIEHGIEQAEATIRQAETDLENTVITSPIDGVITALNAEVGETVIVGTTNNPGSVILEIADLSQILLTAQVDETNIAPVREGQKARVYVNAYADDVFEGRVQRVGLKRQVAADGTGIFEVEILLEVPEGRTLLSGLTASTDIEVETFYDIVAVPSQAVVDRRIDELPKEVVDASTVLDKDKTFASVVYRFVDGKAVATPVKIGPSDLTHTVIEAGLSAGDRVVAGPYRELVTIKHDQAIADMDAPEPGKDGAPSDGAPAEGVAQESDNGAAEAESAAAARP
jgi:HlyD family secretion protein